MIKNIALACGVVLMSASVSYATDMPDVVGVQMATISGNGFAGNSDSHGNLVLPPLLAATAQEVKDKRDSKMESIRANNICQEAGFDRAMDFEIYDGLGWKEMTDFQKGVPVIVHNETPLVVRTYSPLSAIRNKNVGDGWVETDYYGQQFGDITCIRTTGKGGQKKPDQTAISAILQKAAQPVALPGGSASPAPSQASAQ